MNWLLLHPLLSIFALLITSLIVLVNVLAYRHARAMVTFKESGEKTIAPENLSTAQKISVLFSGVTVLRPDNDTTPSDVNLEFSTHNLTVNGNKIEGWFIPNSAKKGTVLLFHGYAAPKSQMLPHAREFHDMGYCVFMIDFRASGGSELNQTSVGYAEADEVAEAVRYADTLSGKKPVILYGLSMGAAAVLRAIAVNNVEPDIIIIEGVFDSMISNAINRFRSMGLPWFPSAYLLTFWGGLQQGFPAFRHNPSDYALKVHCPTLVIHGIHDPRATIEQAGNVFRNLKGSKQFEQYEMEHESCLETFPERWKKTVNRFVEDYG